MLIGLQDLELFILNIWMKNKIVLS